MAGVACGVGDVLVVPLVGIALVPTGEVVGAVDDGEEDDCVGSPEEEEEESIAASSVGEELSLE